MIVLRAPEGEVWVDMNAAAGERRRRRNAIPDSWDGDAGRLAAVLPGGAAVARPMIEEGEMVARTSSWKGSAETLGRWAEHVERQVKPFVAALPGNAGAVFLIDREGGTGLTLTLWESEDAAAETDRNAEQSRASTVEATGIELVERGRWEVVARL